MYVNLNVFINSIIYMRCIYVKKYECMDVLNFLWMFVFFILVCMNIYLDMYICMHICMNECM